MDCEPGVPVVTVISGKPIAKWINGGKALFSPSQIGHRGPPQTSKRVWYSVIVVSIDANASSGYESSCRVI
jgi:hypothetical protein